MPSMVKFGPEKEERRAFFASSMGKYSPAPEIDILLMMNELFSDRNSRREKLNEKGWRTSLAMEHGR